MSNGSSTSHAPHDPAVLQPARRLGKDLAALALMTVGATGVGVAAFLTSPVLGLAWISVLVGCIGLMLGLE